MPPDPEPGDLPVVASDIAAPRCDAGELRITWAGHSSFLIQLPGLNVLTDPVWSHRVSPVSFVGTRRFVAPAPPLEALPPIDAVLLSHDHYDHLDRPTVDALRRLQGDAPSWYTPLGYADWFSGRGVAAVERDWWDEAAVGDTGYRVVAAPARHWTRRTPWGTNRRLWCSWAILPPQPGGPAVYFGGDSGHGGFFAEIGERLGPFAASIIPIGAYEPRWFMGASHMNPEEAVDVHAQLGGTGAFVPAHWGTFRLTFEPPLEPPVRLRAAWEEAGLEPGDLRVPRHGETVILSRTSEREPEPGGFR